MLNFFVICIFSSLYKGEGLMIVLCKVMNPRKLTYWRQKRFWRKESGTRPVHVVQLQSPSIRTMDNSNTCSAHRSLVLRHCFWIASLFWLGTPQASELLLMMWQSTIYDRKNNLLINLNGQFDWIKKHLGCQWVAVMCVYLRVFASRINWM